MSEAAAASTHISHSTLIFHPNARRHSLLLLQVLHAVKAHRKLKQAGIGQRLVHEVLCIELEKDGSDTWRLEPVIEVLKQGGVSEQHWLSCGCGCRYGMQSACQQLLLDCTALPVALCHCGWAKLPVCHAGVLAS